MFTCYVCKKLFNSVKDLMFHITKLCPKYSLTELGYRCGEDKCHRHYYCSNSFRKHLHLCHSAQDVSNISSLVPSVSKHLEPVGFDGVQCASTSTVSTLKSVHFSSVDPNIRMMEETSLFLASLYLNPLIPRSAIQTFVSSLSSFLGILSETLKLKFQVLVPKEHLNDGAAMAFEEVLSVLTNSISPFDTEFKRLQEFSRRGSYIAPQDLTIGHRRNTLGRQTVFNSISQPCKIQLISLREVLRNFFSIEEVWKETMAYVKGLKDALKVRDVTPSSPLCIENIIQGSVWQKLIQSSNKLQVDDAITFPLIVFYDDFEVGNPLGSHAGQHKLGGIYVSIPALPPYLFSQLKHVFLLGLCHASDRITFGNKAIFDPIIKELNYLKNNGILIDTDGFQGTVKFRVAAITGDNLGLNSILGFTESFSANFCCRVCNADRKGVQTLTFESNTLLRTMSSYDNQLALGDISKTGIKEPCCWLSLDDFNLFENVAMDPMHDILEGVARYTMTFVVNHYLNLSVFHTKTLQERVFSFDFGPDSSSSPCNCFLVDGKSVKVKTSAAEMLTLIRYFGLLVGYYIPTGDKVWDLYLHLRKITDMLLSHRVYSDTNEQLKFFIADFNRLYCELTKEPLKPKFHFLTHYTTMLLKFGPLCHIWAMRFEAKHRVLKTAARSSSSRINICKTISIKNQLLLNELFLRKKLPLNLQYGKIIPTGTSLNLDLGSNSLLKGSINWVKIKGVTWKPSYVCTLDVSEETSLPDFGIVQKIYLSDDDEVYLSCLLLETLSFDEHYHAFEVCKTEKSSYVPCRSLVAPYPGTLTLMRDLTYYVTSR